MSNLKTWILDAADGDPVESVVIGNMGWSDYKLEYLPESAQDSNNWHKVLPWSQAEKLVDYEFDSGYGSPGCQAITAWTQNKVIFVSQYDGATGICSVPRNPTDHIPDMPGG